MGAGCQRAFLAMLSVKLRLVDWIELTVLAFACLYSSSVLVFFCFFLLLHNIVKDGYVEVTLMF